MWWWKGFMIFFPLAALRMFLQEVAAVAPALPFYYYHIPSMTGVHCENTALLYLLTILFHKYHIYAVVRYLLFM